MYNALELRVGETKKIVAESNLPLEYTECAPAFYNAGALVVIRDMAKLVNTSRKVDKESIARAEKACDDLLRDLRAFIVALPEQQHETGEELLDRVNDLCVTATDGGFMDGFIAGYTLLKNLNQI